VASSSVSQYGNSCSLPPEAAHVPAPAPTPQEILLPHKNWLKAMLWK
jgi:hypothetical protein